MFVLPMSLAAAVTIWKRGYRLGPAQCWMRKTAARTGLGVGICMAVVTAIFTVTCVSILLLLYNDNPWRSWRLPRN